MDKSELAALMLQWESVQKRADGMKAAIADAVLQLEETQSVGNVRATYSGGRKTYDYQEAADGHPMVNDATVELFTTIPAPKVDWRGICKHAGIDNVPFTESAPSVTVKLAA